MNLPPLSDSRFYAPAGQTARNRKSEKGAACVVFFLWTGRLRWGSKGAPGEFRVADYQTAAACG